MCDPATIAAVTLAASYAAPVAAAASSIAGFVGQKQQAKAQEMAAQDAYIANQSALDQQQLQQNERASQQMSARALEAMRERGRLRAIAAEIGGGNSTDRLMGEVNLTESTDMATIERNRAMAESQSQLQKKGMQAQAQGQINTSNRPSALGLALDLAGTGLNAYNKAPATKSTLKIPEWKPTGSRDYW